MRTITLNIDEQLVEAAEERARLEHTTLNEQFHIWLSGYARQSRKASETMAVVAELQERLRTGGRKFTRDEMNER